MDEKLTAAKVTRKRNRFFSFVFFGTGGGKVEVIYENGDFQGDFHDFQISRLAKFELIVW